MKNSCCTDIIAAEKINYDIIFHMGPTCFTTFPKDNSEKEIFYIFQKKKFDEKIFLQEFLQFQKSQALPIFVIFFLISVQ